MQRVVITGAGTVNALGGTAQETWAALRAGHCGIAPLAIRDVERLSIRIGAAVQDWDPTGRLPPERIALCDRVSQFACVAAREAILSSGLLLEGDLAQRTGVVIGCAGGGLATQDESYRQVYAEAKTRVHPFTVPRLMASAPASHISIDWGLRGPVLAVSTACAASNHAMGLAFQMVRSGAAPAMVTGGAEAMLTFGGIKAWEALRVLSPDGCRPFARGRNGMVMGEGAGIFVFESLDHARARNAPMLAEVAGFAMGSDAQDLVLPSVEGAARAMRGALADAGLAPEAIGYVNAHGTGTRANDRVEAAAIGEVFGARAPGGTLPVTSTKSMHGHLIGATGAVELLACIMALREGVIPPTLGYDAADPECPLDVVPARARRADVAAALSNAFAFGGLNAVLALKRI